MTDLDDLRRIWAAQDVRLEHAMRLNTRTLEALALDDARPALQRLERFQWAAAVVWAMILLGLGSFAADHLGEPVLCLSAILAGLYTVWMLNAALRQAIIAHGMNYSTPVTKLLDEAATLRVRRIEQARVGVLAGTAVWAPFFIVACKAVFGVDFYSPAWLAANILFGLALSAAWIFAARRFGSRMARYPAMQRLLDDIAGHNLNEATRFLAELNAFKSEQAA